VDLPENLSVRGLVTTVQIKNLDFKARHASFVLKVPDEVVTECLKKIRTFL